MLEKQARVVIRMTKSAIKSNAKLRSLFYDVSNSGMFTSLYMHETMLGDQVRVDTYARGIERHVGRDDLVLDLGTGSGILAFLAAQRQPRRVYAVDHSPFMDVAERIARHNDIRNIEFVRSNSREFAPPERVDVVIHEQLGDDLFNENMVENLLDLKRRVLKDGGKIIPGIFELFLEPVSVSDDRRAPFIWENQIHGIDYGFLRDDPALDPYRTDGYASTWVQRGTIAHLLGQPEPILRFDLNELERAGDLPTRLDASRMVDTAGSFDGFCLYFRLIFDDDISFDTSPLSPPTHWRNRLFRAKRERLSQGDVIDYTLGMKDLIDARTWTVTWATTSVTG